HTRGLPKAIARAAAAIPPAAGRTLASAPGRLGTTLGMSASIAESQAIQRRLIETTDQMVVLNQTAKWMLEANGAPSARIVVNRLGLDRNRLRSGRTATSRPVRFGFVGRFHPTNGVYELARAIRS